MAAISEILLLLRKANFGLLHDSHAFPLPVYNGKAVFAHSSYALFQNRIRQTSAMSLSEEITMLRKRVKEQDKEIRLLKEENEFLEEASAFFAASRRKSAKTRE